jgi:hypothetical protein
MVSAQLLIPLAMCLVTLQETINEEQTSKKLEDDPAGIARRIVDDPQGFQTDFHRLRPFVGNDRVAAAVIAKTKETTVDKQQMLIGVIATLGSQLPDPAEPAISRYRFVESGQVIDFCVGLLKSPDSQLRSQAANILGTRVRPKEIQARAAEILTAITQPASSDDYLILGMTQNHKALERIPKPSDVEEVLRPARQLAAAMLGDPAAEEQIIDSFRKSDSPERQNELAMALARIGSTKSLTALASALRSPRVAQWGGTGKQSFRLIVIACLSWAYPEEKVFWEPRTVPASDKYYETIELWAEKHLKIRWDQPRPPFMYQEYAPMFPRVPQ